MEDKKTEAQKNLDYSDVFRFFIIGFLFELISKIKQRSYTNTVNSVNKQNRQAKNKKQDCKIINQVNIMI